MPAERKLKGVNFHGTLTALSRKYGQEVRARVEQRVEGEAGEAIRHKAIVTGGWYPASFYDALLRAIEDELPGEKGVIRELSKSAVIDDFGTLFKIISLIASPETALKNGLKVAQRYVDGGKITMPRSEWGEMQFKFEEFYGYTTRMWDDWIGGMEAILLMLKLELYPFKILSGGGNSDRLEILVRYKTDKK